MTIKLEIGEKGIKKALDSEKITKSFVATP